MTFAAASRRLLSPLFARLRPPPTPDPDRDRAVIEAALKTRLPPHLRKDVGAGDG